MQKLQWSRLGKHAGIHPRLHKYWAFPRICFTKTIDLLFPPRSLTGVPGTFITEQECRKLRGQPVVINLHQLRIQGLTALDHLSAANVYHKDSLLRDAIHLFKYRRIPLLSETLGYMMASAGFPVRERSVLVPVPLHFTRRFWRGFNQAELLAQVIADERGVPVRYVLKRKRATGHQARRTRAERLTALEDAFVFTADDVPQSVILVDDIATTGATLDACAVVLKEAGVEWVEGWVIAHG